MLKGCPINILCCARLSYSLGCKWFLVPRPFLVSEPDPRKRVCEIEVTERNVWNFLIISSYPLYFWNFQPSVGQIRATPTTSLTSRSHLFSVSLNQSEPQTQPIRKGLGNNLAQNCPAGMPQFLNSANFLFQIFMRLVRYYSDFPNFYVLPYIRFLLLV